MNSVQHWAVSDLPSFHAHQIAESRCGCGKSKLQSVQPFIDNKVQVFDICKPSMCFQFDHFPQKVCILGAKIWDHRNCFPLLSPLKTSLFPLTISADGIIMPRDLFSRKSDNVGEERE
jgi:hypothetical protein